MTTPLNHVIAVTVSMAALTVPLAIAVAAPADAALSYSYRNCSALNEDYPHGVGRTHAHDKTSGDPVTNFKHSTKLYKKLTKHHKGLDRDKDGIACEKH